MYLIWVPNSHKICNNVRPGGITSPSPFVHKAESFRQMHELHEPQMQHPLQPATKWCQTMQIAVRKGSRIRMGLGLGCSGALWSYCNANTSAQHTHTRKHTHRQTLAPDTWNDVQILLTIGASNSISRSSVRSCSVEWSPLGAVLALRSLLFGLPFPASFIPWLPRFPSSTALCTPSGCLFFCGMW